MKPILPSLFAFCLTLLTSVAAEPAIPLAREWKFELDPKDNGTSGQWFNKDLGGSIQLPGTITTNKLGNPITAIRQQIWGGDFTDKPVWHPMLRYDYRGNAWYQTTVEIPQAWAGQSVELFLERVCWVSEAWLDGKSSGSIDTLSAPHRHVFGSIAPGKHRLTLRIDNRQLHDLGCNTHAYHEQSCTIYNGVIGKIELRANALVSVKSNRMFPDARSGSVEMRLTFSNATGKPQETVISTSVRADGGKDALASESRKVTLPPGETKLTVPVKLPGAAVKLWSEFERPLYQARVEIKSAAGNALNAKTVLLSASSRARARVSPSMANRCCFAARRTTRSFLSPAIRRWTRPHG